MAEINVTETPEYKALEGKMQKLEADYLKHVGEIATSAGRMADTHDAMNQKITEQNALIADYAKSVKTTGEELARLGIRVVGVDDRVKQLFERKTPLGGRDPEAEERSQGLSEFIAAVLRGDRTKIDEIRKRTLTTGTTGSGAEIIPPAYLPEIIHLEAEASVILPFARHFTMTGPTLTVPTLGNVVSAWEDEDVDQTEFDTTNLTGKVTLNAKTRRILIPISNENLADANPDIGNALKPVIAEEFALAIDQQALLGTGAGGANPFTGWLVKSGVVEHVMTTGKNTYGEIDAKELSDLIGVLPSKRLVGARFICSRTVLAVLRGQVGTDGHSVWSPPGGTMPATIWGYPYSISDQLPQTGDAGSQASKAFVAFGNPNWVFIGDRQQMEIQVSSEFLFGRNTTCLRAVQRVGSEMGSPPAVSRLVTAAT